MGVLLGAILAAANAQALSSVTYTDETELAQLLWTQSPEVLEARAAAGSASSELIRARTLPNPALDFTWGTIPLGRNNPPDLHDPLSNVPNYTAGVSQLVELGKRSPKRAAAGAELERAQAQAVATYAGRFFDLLGSIGRIATTQQRAAVMADQVEASEELLNLDRARAAKGYIADVDFERTEVEHARLVAQRDAALTELASARADCAMIIAADCPQFASGDKAREFLQKGAAVELPEEWSKEAEERRPDLSALDAAVRAAKQRTTLAERRKIPDVTVRLGYTYDEFITAGNQRNSLAVGLQVPLPLADHGQADLEAALTTLQRSEQIHQALLATAPARIAVAVQRRQLVRSRIEHLDEALAKALSVRDSLIAAQRQGGTSQIEVLLGRRAYQELLLERLDLDGDAYDAALSIRQSLALFPRPAGAPEERNP